MKELTTRQRQAIETKHKIQETAAALLQAESYDRLTMSQIATAAGISVGTLYHHFKSKEELFFSGYRRFDDMVEALEHDFVFPSNVEAIRSMVYAQTVGAFYNGINYISSILTLQLSTHGTMFYSDKRSFPRYIYDHVAQAVSKGELITPNGSESIAQAILRLARGCIFDCTVRNQPESISTLIQHDLNLLLSSYCPADHEAFPPIDTRWLEAYTQWRADN